MIFPGGSHVFHLEQKTAERLLEHVAHLEPPQFAYLPISAWGDPGTVGTLAVIDELQITPDGSASLLCTGLSRFSIIHLDEKLENARVELLHDALPAPEDEEDIVELERKLVQTMTQIVQLSIKISSAEDEQRQIALTETLKRVEAFCGKCSEEESRMLLQHWILDLEPHLRRELLSFIVIDLLSVSFMERKSMMLSTNTGNRMGEALSGLQPFVKELAAKGAIVSALGKGASEGDEDVTSPSS